MRTFENSSKTELLNKLKHHQKLDTFIQGEWLTNEKVKGNGFKGCFYGCTMQTSEDPIEKFSDKYSIDLWYCYLTEKIFENLPYGEYQKFPLQSIQILPKRFDIYKIKSPFFYRLLMDPEHGQINYAGDNKEVKKAIEQCAELFKQDFNKIAGSAAWSDAESAARSAWSDAESAARSAWSAAESAAWSAWSARSAWSDAESAARSARSAHYIWMRDMLFEVIKENS